MPTPSILPTSCWLSSKRTWHSVAQLAQFQRWLIVVAACCSMLHRRIMEMPSRSWRSWVLTHLRCQMRLSRTQWNFQGVPPKVRQFAHYLLWADSQKHHVKICQACVVRLCWEIASQSFRMECWIRFSQTLLAFSFCWTLWEGDGEKDKHTRELSEHVWTKDNQ